MARVISLQQYLARPRLRGLIDEGYEYVTGGSEPGPGGGGSGSGGFRGNPTVAAVLCAGKGGTYNEATDQCEYDDGGSPTTGGGSYGPSPQDCAAAGAIYDAATGQCIAREPVSGGSQFQPYTGEPGDGDDGTNIPPWVQKGIEKCADEGKGYDAASDSCFDCPDGFDADGNGGCSETVKATPRTGGGGGGGGYAKPKPEKTSGTSSQTTRGLVGALVGGLAGTALGAGGGQLAMKRPGTGAAVGGVVGALLGGIVGAMSDGGE